MTEGDSRVRSIYPIAVRRHGPEGDLMYTVAPHDGQTFDNPPFPMQRQGSVEGGTEKYPIQATSDLELDCPSTKMAINAPAFLSDAGSRSRSRYSFNSSPASFSSSAFTSARDCSGHFSTYTPPRFSDYVASYKRHDTFKTTQWLADEKPNVSTLVDLGFFFTGREDLVRCFQCGIGLKDWMRDDDVIMEHVKHSANCPYILQKLGRARLQQIKNEIVSESVSRNTQSSASGSQQTYKITSPKYQTMGARLASFQSYPDIGIQTKLMAVAGLYYTGNGDLCRCFACDGGLKDWSAGDDPCKEHARYFPHCGYISQLKGREYVRVLQQQQRENNVPQGATGGQSQSANTSSLPSMDRLSLAETSSDHLQAMVEEHEKLTEMIQCMLCVTDEPEVLFLPCAHHRVCHKCAEKMDRCPKCSMRITEKIRTYRA